MLLQMPVYPMQPRPECLVVQIGAQQPCCCVWHQRGARLSSWVSCGCSVAASGCRLASSACWAKPAARLPAQQGPLIQDMPGLLMSCAAGVAREATPSTSL